MDDYRSAFAVAQSHPRSRVPRPQPPGDVRLAPCAEIGIGLTGAGLLFMLLGMMMFFDKGLLAMGNVRRVLSGPRLHIAATVLTVAASASADPVPFGRDDDHRHQQDLPLLLPEAQAQRWEPPERAHSRLATSPLASHPVVRVRVRARVRASLPPTPHFPPAPHFRPTPHLPAARHGVLLGRHRAGAARLASHRHGRRGLRLPQPIRVHRARSDFLSIALG